MKIFNNIIKIQDEHDIKLITDLVMNDESFNECNSFIKNGKKYYTQTYCIDDVCFEVFVNWEDNLETCELDFFIGQEFKIR